MRKTLGATIGAVIAAACLMPAAAAADTVTMGSTLSRGDDGGLASAPFQSTQLAFDPSTSPNPTVAPADGVITDWKVRSADDGALYTLKVLQPNGPVATVVATNTNFTAVRSVSAPSAVPIGTGASTPTGAVFDYPLSSPLPISKGDYIGLLATGAVDEIPQAFANGLHADLIANNFTAQPADGNSANLLSDEQHELLLQATIKFCKVPDLTGKSQADATAALTSADCAAGNVTTQPLVFKKRKVHGKKAKAKQRSKLAALRAQDGTVVSETPAAGSTGAPGTTVDFALGKLQIMKKHKKK